MKFTVLITIFTLSTHLSFAASQIGDYAQMTGVEVETNRPVRLERTLLSLKLTKGLVREVGTDLETGEVEIKEVWESRVRLLGNRTVKLILKACRLIGGSYENIKTAVGEFRTCKLNVDEGESTIWVGKVPFGIVQVNSPFEFGRVQGQISDFRFAGQSTINTSIPKN